MRVTCLRSLQMVLNIPLTLALAGCGGGGAGSEPTTTSTARSSGAVLIPSADPIAPVAPTAPTALDPLGFKLGVNVASLDYWSGERSFSNLLVGSGWVDKNNSWKDIVGQVDANGVITLQPGQEPARVLVPPAVTAGSVTIRCTWSGSGDVWIGGNAGSQVKGDHNWEFSWAAPAQQQRVWLSISRSVASDPVRDLDCREKDAARNELYAPEFVQSLKPFGVIRFLDWSGANGNAPSVTWATRTPTNVMAPRGPDGVALENVIALATQTNVDPWFNIPWNADEDYVRHMAQLVHDTLPANRRVYVELGNEVWNYGFSVTKQAETEGVAAGLADNPGESMLRRYAEKTTWAMKIWAQVFADRPNQLVRVAATQHANSWAAETVLGWKDTAANVDALATAPYFGHDLFDQQSSSELAVLMPAMARWPSMR